MAMEVNVPDIGSDEVEVTEILVKAGDQVDIEQPLITVEGDKASMEVPAPQAGVIEEIKIAVGDKIKTGDLMMLFASASVATPVQEKPSSTSVAATSDSSAAAAVCETVTVPDIGDDEAEVTEILVNVGDTVAAEQPLLTVEGDKASMEIPAPFAGVVKTIDIAVGAKVKTGLPIMVFTRATSTGVVPATAARSETAPVDRQESTQTVVLPDIGDDEVEVTDILVKPGDNVAAEQSLLTIEGDKASMEVPAPFAGTVKTITIAIGDKVKTGLPIMIFGVQGAPAADNGVQPSSTPPQVAASAPATVVAVAAKSGFVESAAYVHATPLVRRLAREFGVDLGQVKGSGRKGRILKEDVQAYVKQALQNKGEGVAQSGMPGMLPWPTPDYRKFGEVEEVEIGRIQKISGANLSRNWALIPHVTQHDEADITELEAFRKQQNSEAEKQKLDVKITPLVFLLKAVAKGLETFPRFNSSLTADAQRLYMKKYIHIGVAVDTPNGLVVPVLRDVNRKGIIELSRELADISKKARAGKLSAADMQGGCFTISSLGGIGCTAFAPIVNAPEVAILGVSRSSFKPIWNGKEFVPRLMLPLSLSFDHRVIDGAEGARFITFLRQVISDIRRLIM